MQSICLLSNKISFKIQNMQQTQSSSKDLGIDKFIKLMRNLTQLIIADPIHRKTIYECLNSEQIKRLFESIHDQNTQIRMTAINFLCQLLNNNSRIIELIGVLQGYEAIPGMRKYILGGLEYYQLQPNQLKRRHLIKQPEIVISLNKIKYQPDVLAWAIHKNTAKIQYYFTSNKTKSSETFPFDPNQQIIGIFVKGEELGQIEKRIGAGRDNRYKISKK